MYQGSCGGLKARECYNRQNVHPGTKPIHQERNFFVELICARIHAGPVFAHVRIQEQIFEESFSACLRNFSWGMRIHAAPIFAHVRVQGKSSMRIIYVLVSCQKVQRERGSRKAVYPGPWAATSSANRCSNPQKGFGQLLWNPRPTDVNNAFSEKSGLLSLRCTVGSCCHCRSFCVSIQGSLPKPSRGKSC